MKTIGRTDKADFPDLHLKNINIKIDTGAYTSSIHCHDIREVEVNGEKQIEFKLLDPSHPKYQDKIFKVGKYREKSVKSSFGTKEQRYIITTHISIFGEKFHIELSLSERSEMKYPVLIGRKFLKKKFIVDPSQKNVAYKLKKETQKRTK